MPSWRRVRWLQARRQCCPRCTDHQATWLPSICRRGPAKLIRWKPPPTRILGSVLRQTGLLALTCAIHASVQALPQELQHKRRLVCFIAKAAPSWAGWLLGVGKADDPPPPPPAQVGNKKLQSSAPKDISGQALGRWQRSMHIIHEYSLSIRWQMGGFGPPRLISLAPAYLHTSSQHWVDPLLSPKVGAKMVDNAILVPIILIDQGASSTGYAWHESRSSSRLICRQSPDVPLFDHQALVSPCLHLQAEI